MTALVSLSVGGAITGFSFVPKAAADISSPTSMPLNLVALRQSVQSLQPDRAAPSHDALLRAAIVHVAGYYLRMAQTKTPAEMEAIIWQHDSSDGVDHGESCAAFASLTLELGAQVVGGQSWVSGGGSYPWPLHSWADVRVEANPASMGIISIQQDAEAHDRWHPLGDGYQPLPGDWVLFDGHVEVVTKDTGGVLQTVGGDSLPNFSVNAHQYPEPPSSAGVVGFVNNGALPAGTQAAGANGHVRKPGAGHAADRSAGHPSAHASSAGGAQAAQNPAGGGPDASGAPHELAAIPGAAAVPAARSATDPAIPGLVPAQRSSSADGGAATPVPKARPGRKTARAAEDKVAPGVAAIPGLTPSHLPQERGAAYRRHHPSPVPAPMSETQAQQAFISEVAPGARAAQRRYGVPAAVTIAQAIDESGWGQSELAAQDHNLFGIKGTGPAGSVPLPTQEYVNGQPVSTSAAFRVYHNVAESIDDHGRLLARSGYYEQAMADRQHPDRFAAALTGVYATDPNYGASLISLMRRYDLYRYGTPDQGQAERAAAVSEQGSPSIPGIPAASPPAVPKGSASAPPASPRPAAPVHTASPEPTRTASPGPTRTASPEPTRTASPEPTRTASPEPTRTASPGPTRTASPRPTPPTRTASPGPTRTVRPEPARSASPEPARTVRPEPARSASPEPSAAASAQPSAPASSQRTPAVTNSSPAAAPGRASAGSASIPGIGGGSPQSESARRLTAGRAGVPPGRARATAAAARSTPSVPRATLVSARRYQPQMPRSVLNSFVETAKAPLLAEETTYRDVASFRGISWQLLAACDWMQCDARSRRSPVYGERLGTMNADGTVYTQRSAALGRCADDLVRLARSVYGIDLTRGRDLSVRDLANAFAAFRWGGLLKAHDCSAMEFPYSVAGLTEHHLGMRWPRIAVPGTGDRPGSRFRRPFGAVPIVLGLDYQATV
jgi:flagellum-specific peptidoglycan hydrolase FlgJ